MGWCWTNLTRYNYSIGAATQNSNQVCRIDIQISHRILEDKDSRDSMMLETGDWSASGCACAAKYIRLASF